MELSQFLLDHSSRLKHLREKCDLISERASLDAGEFNTKITSSIKRIDDVLNWFSSEPLTNVKHDEKVNQSFKTSEIEVLQREKEKENADKIFPILFENASDIITVQNDRFEYEYFNEPVVKKILGYSKEDLLGKTNLELIHPDDRKRTILASSKILRKGKGLHEVRFKCKNDTYKWLEVTAKNFFNDRGEKKTLTILRDISERKEMEHQLRESEEKYRCLFEYSPNMIILLDSSGMIVNMNSTFLNVFGHEKRDLIEKDFRQLDVISPQNLIFFNNKFKEIFQKEYIEPFEICTYDQNQWLRWLVLRASLIKINGNSIVQIVLQDTSEFREAEQKLKDSETKYRNLFTMTPFSILLIDSEGTIIDCNPSTSALSGYQKEEIVNKKFFDLPFVISEYKSLMITRFLNILRGEILPSFDIRIKTRDDRLIWINYTSSLVKIGEKSFIQVVAHDVTEKKKTEQELMTSEKKFRKIFEAIPDLFFLVSKDTEILEFNGKIESLNVPLPPSISGKKITDLVPENLKFLVENAVKRTIDSQEPSITEFSLLLKGIEHHFEARHLYFSEDHVAIFVRDISERKKAENLKKEEMQKLKDLDEIRSSLITRISHELNTPLVSICGGAELLLDEFKDKIDKKALELIEMIEKGGLRLRMLVENLLDASRLDHDKFVLKKELTDLSAIINKCSKEMTFWIQARDITLDLHLPDILYLEIDRTRIEQVILNLLSNSIKNTPPRGKIKVFLKKVDDHAKIIVRDTGVGLIKDEMDKIFTRFGKIERQGLEFAYLNIEGAGLGLFISKEIVDMHGGQIWAASRGRNKGSTFIVKLPMKC